MPALWHELLVALMEKRHLELSWWQGYYNSLGADGFEQQRFADWLEMKSHFPGLCDEKGEGLDLGSGPLSMLEFSGLVFWAYDPLMHDYKKIIPLSERHLGLRPREMFDWMLCCNVIDHTPDPDELIEYIYKYLKPEGKLYFEVNFDSVLGNPHYELWNEELVQNKLSNFKLISKEIESRPQYSQKRYWAVYKKEK